MNAYRELRDRHQKEINDLPLEFAFSDKQFANGMANLGLTPDDTDKIYSLSGTGGFYRRSDAELIRETFYRLAEESQAAVDADTTGDGYIYQMFCYELANHEYGYTRDITSTLEALDLTMEDIEKSKPLTNGLKKAIAHVTGG